MAADARAIIQNIYTSELGRAADPGGLEFYIGELQKGKTADQVRAEISASTEGMAFDARNPADVVSALYQQELGRSADPGGLAAYTEALQSGTSAERIREILNASNEGRQADMAAVQRAYRDQLGREADPGGLNNYLSLIQQGYTQADIENMLNQSEEGRIFDEQTLKSGYQSVLGRTPDASGMGFWLDKMRSDINIDPTNINAYLEGGRSGTDVKKTGTGTTGTGTTGTGTTVTGAGGTDTTKVTTGTGTAAEYYYTDALGDVYYVKNGVPTKIGTTRPTGTTAVSNAGTSGLPGAGVEQRISTGALPQRIIAGGAPITIGGGFAAYPYGTQALADQLGIPMLRLQDVVSMGTMPSNLVTAPTTMAGLGFQNIVNPTNPFIAPGGAAGNPYANAVYGAPFIINADTLNPYGLPTGTAPGGVRITNPPPTPAGGGTSGGNTGGTTGSTTTP